MAAKKRFDHPAHVTLLLLTDADTGPKIAVNSGYILTFTEGDRRDTTVFRFTNGELLTVDEDFMTVVLGFMPRA
jgi:hypothetical protein